MRVRRGFCGFPQFFNIRIIFHVIEETLKEFECFLTRFASVDGHILRFHSTIHLYDRMGEYDRSYKYKKTPSLLVKGLTHVVGLS